MASADSVTGFNMETTDNVTAVTYVQITKASMAVTSIIFSLIFFVGVICNTLVITTICRTHTLRTSSINRAVLSLCLADLLTSMLDVPFTFIILLGNYLEIMVRCLLYWR